MQTHTFTTYCTQATLEANFDLLELAKPFARKITYTSRVGDIMNAGWGWWGLASGGSPGENLGEFRLYPAKRVVVLRIPRALGLLHP